MEKQLDCSQLYVTADDAMQYVHRQLEWEGRKEENITIDIYREKLNPACWAEYG